MCHRVFLSNISFPLVAEVNYLQYWRPNLESYHNMVIPQWGLTSDFQPHEGMYSNAKICRQVGTLDGTKPRLSALWPPTGDVLGSDLMLKTL